MRYVSEVSNLSAAQLAGFFADWPRPPAPAEHLRLLLASDSVDLAFDGEQLIGFAAAVSDGVMTAFVTLLEVLPQYRGRGVGSTLMRRMVARYGHLRYLVLHCDSELAPFYERFGFQVAAGVQMLRLGADQHPDDG